MDRRKIRLAIRLAEEGKYTVCGTGGCGNARCEIMTEAIKEGYLKGEIFGKIELTFQGEMAAKSMGL